MQVQRLLLAAIYKARNQGLAAVISSIWKNLRSRRDFIAFDQKFGTNTEISVPLWKLKINSQNVSDGTHYQSGDPDFVRRAIKELRIDFEQFVYIDLGSGKGRTLLVASDFPFKKIIGVEFSKELNDISLRNIAIYPRSKCLDVTSIACDASLYEFPAENMVIFMYNPFGESVLRPVLDNLKRSLAQSGKTAYLIYFNPVLAEIVKQSGGMTPIWKTDQPIEAISYRSLPDAE